MATKQRQKVKSVRFDNGTYQHELKQQIARELLSTVWYISEELVDSQPIHVPTKRQTEIEASEDEYSKVVLTDGASDLLMRILVNANRLDDDKRSWK